MRTDRLAGRKDTRRDSRLEACDHHVDRGLAVPPELVELGWRPEEVIWEDRRRRLNPLASFAICGVCLGTRPRNQTRSGRVVL